MKFEYIGPSSTDDQSTKKMTQTSLRITWRVFRKVIPDARQKLEEIGAIQKTTFEKSIAESTSITFHKGWHGGQRAYYVTWAGRQWIWVG